MQTMAVNFIDDQLRAVINARLAKLTPSSPPHATIEFPIFLTRNHRSYIHEMAKTMGLHSTTYQKNGIKYVKVYKRSCSNFAKLAPTFRLTDLSQKVIFHYLKTYRNSSSSEDWTTVNHAISAGSESQAKPKIAIYRFCAGTINNTMLSVPPINQNDVAVSVFRQGLPSYRYRDVIVETVQRSQVTILIGDSIVGRATEIPQYLLEEYCRRNANCRIICSLSHKVSAVLDSEVVSSQRGERLGVTVGYQIPLESMSSMSTNLLYTTSNFFLRCLMGSNKHELFAAITHVIVDDISEHDAFTDMLLYEIQQILPSYPGLKVILMCSPMDTAYLQKRFGNATPLDLSAITDTVMTYHRDQVMQIVDSRILSSPASVENGELNFNIERTDAILSKCMATGDESAFEHFINLLRTGQVDINAQHSETRVTFGMAAARHEQLNYLMMFESLGGDIFLVDSNDRSALAWAKHYRSEDCAEFLQERTTCRTINGNIYDGLPDNQVESPKWDHQDQQQISDAINFLLSSTTKGTILAFLPTFRDIVKQEFNLKQRVNSGLIPDNFKIELLHNHISITELRSMNQVTNSSQRKVILSTDISASVLASIEATFVIDSGRKVEAVYDDYDVLLMNRLVWISQSCANMRRTLAKPNGLGGCFRLYTRDQLEHFPQTENSIMSRIGLGNICLYAKLLSPTTTIKEYFSRLMKNPPYKRIEQTAQLLEAIGALDASEAITILGVRLVDIPVDVRLGKVLLFAIVMQCLDPVLTIVSSLSYEDPAFLLHLVKTKSVHFNLHSNPEAFSDHLLLLRLYQNWLDCRSFNEIAVTEDDYILNAQLEIISLIRSQIVGTLRAASMIQSSGTMNIHFINVHSNNWPLAKAAFVAGMYPNVCRIDREFGNIRFRDLSRADVGKESVFASNEIDMYPTDWMLYQTKESSENNRGTNIICNSLITPITLALFAGDMALPREEIMPLDSNDSDSDSESFRTDFKSKSTRFNIDNYLSFILDSTDAKLIYEFRKKFYNFFSDVIRLSEDAEKFRWTKAALHNKFNIIESIGNLLQLEEQAYCLPEPQNVGERPNAYSASLTRNQFRITALKNSMMDAQPSLPMPTTTVKTQNRTKKAYFILHVRSPEQSIEYFRKTFSIDTTTTAAWRNIISKYRQFPALNIVVFLLAIDSNSFCGVGNLFFDGSRYYLIEIARKNVRIDDFRALHYTNGLKFRGCHDGEELDANIGKMLMNMFE